VKESSFRRRGGPASDRGPVRHVGKRAAVAAGIAALGVMLSGAPASAGEAGLTLDQPWMRFIIAARPAAGYFTLANGGSEKKVLTGASSPDCGMVMIHKSMTENGANAMMAMDDGVTVPAHGKVTFAPGGYHLMCMKPSPGMKDAKTVPMTLTFKDGGSISADFAVRGAGGK